MSRAAGRAGRAIHGLLPLDKPVGLGSNAALQRVKRLFRAQRAGHTGTLDPLASGLMIICLGHATKFSAELLDAPKEYEAEITLGIRTSTADAEGEILSRCDIDCDESAIFAVLEAFKGEILQTPPMYSALKRSGVPLYRHARKGIEIHREPRPVVIYRLEVRSIELPRVKFTVLCSKGTYIRTLAEDIGASLRCGAYLSALRRTALGSFNLAAAISLESLESMAVEQLDSLLLPPDRLLARYPEILLDPSASLNFCLGQSVAAPSGMTGLCRIYAPERIFLGTGEVDQELRLHPRRVLSAAAEPCPNAP